MDSQTSGHAPEELYAAFKQAEAYEQVRWTLYLRWQAKAEQKYEEYCRAAAASDHAHKEWTQAVIGEASPVDVGQVTATAT